MAQSVSPSRFCSCQSWVVSLWGGFRNKLGKCKLETLKNVIENSAEQLFVVIHHLNRFVDGVLAMAQQIQCAIVEGFILQPGQTGTLRSSWPKKLAIFSKMLRRALKWYV